MLLLPPRSPPLLPALVAPLSLVYQTSVFSATPIFFRASRSMPMLWSMP